MRATPAHILCARTGWHVTGRRAPGAFVASSLAVVRHPPHARKFAAACGALVLAVTGCGDPEEPATTLDEATAAVLADAAERLADAIEADDDCLAIAEAHGLQERAESALADGLAPPTVAAETVRVAGLLTADLTCEADEDEAADDATDDDDRRDDDGRDDDEGDGDEGDGEGDDEKGKGKGKGKAKDK